MSKPESKRLTKAEGIEFLTRHFRYDTARSWNRGSSYAVKVKLHHLKFPDAESERRAYEFLSSENRQIYAEPKRIMRAFAERHSYAWQIGQNGRNGGYLVLYQGGRKQSQYKSFCTECGQGNFQEAAAGRKRCGRCHADARVNQVRHEVFTTTEGTDMEETFDNWSVRDVAARVRLVRDFDATCQRVCDAFVQFCVKNKLATKTVLVERDIHVVESLA